MFFFTLCLRGKLLFAGQNRNGEVISILKPLIIKGIEYKYNF